MKSSEEANLGKARNKSELAKAVDRQSWTILGVLAALATLLLGVVYVMARF